MEEAKSRRRARLSKAATKEVTTRMLPELAEVLRVAARNEGMTVNDFVVEAVQERLTRGEPAPERLIVTLDRRRTRQVLLDVLDELLPPEPEEEARAS